MEFTQEPQPLDIPQIDQNGGTYKNVKEIKSGDGSFYIDSSGKSEWRDSLGNVVIVIDPNG